MKEWDEDDQEDDEADDDGGDADAAAADDDHDHDDDDDDDVDGEEAADAHANVTITLWYYYSQTFAKFLEARLGTCNAKRAIELCCSLQWTYWEVFVFSGHSQIQELDHIRKVFKQWCGKYLKTWRNPSTSWHHFDTGTLKFVWGCRCQWYLMVLSLCSSQCQTKAVFIGHPLFAGKLRWKGLYRRCFRNIPRSTPPCTRHPKTMSAFLERVSCFIEQTPKQTVCVCTTNYNHCDSAILKSLKSYLCNIYTWCFFGSARIGNNGRSAPVEVKWHISIAWEDVSAPESVLVVGLGKAFLFVGVMIISMLLSQYIPITC